MVFIDIMKFVDHLHNEMWLVVIQGWPEYKGAILTSSIGDWSPHKLEPTLDTQLW